MGGWGSAAAATKWQWGLPITTRQCHPRQSLISWPHVHIHLPPFLPITAMVPSPAANHGELLKAKPRAHTCSSRSSKRTSNSHTTRLLPSNASPHKHSNATVLHHTSKHHPWVGQLTPVAWPCAGCWPPCGGRRRGPRETKKTPSRRAPRSVGTPSRATSGRRSSSGCRSWGTASCPHPAAHGK